MTIKRYGGLCKTREPLHSLVINPATCTSDCDSTSCGWHNLSVWKSCQSQLIYGAPDQITSVFLRCLGVFWFGEYIWRNIWNKLGCCKTPRATCYAFFRCFVCFELLQVTLQRWKISKTPPKFGVLHFFAPQTRRYIVSSIFAKLWSLHRTVLSTVRSFRSTAIWIKTHNHFLSPRKKEISLKIRHDYVKSRRNIPQKMRCCLPFRHCLTCWCIQLQ